MKRMNLKQALASRATIAKENIQESAAAATLDLTVDTNNKVPAIVPPTVEANEHAETLAELHDAVDEYKVATSISEVMSGTPTATDTKVMGAVADSLDLLPDGTTVSAESMKHSAQNAINKIVSLSMRARASK